MQTSQILYTGELRTEAVHLRSGETIITDAPVDNKGKGKNFSPTDLLATSLGCCMITIVGIAANEHGFNIDGTTIKITKIMASNPRRVAEVIVDMNFPRRNYSDKQKALIERSAKTCPVSKSLSKDLIQTIKFNYQDGK
jgi:putative redox protein